MAIKNQDGSTFRLKGPNPIVKTQDFWGEYVLHNFKHKDTVTQEGFISLEEIETEEIEVKIKEEKILKRIDKTLILCLPATITEHRDTLYDEIKTSVSYGNQFSFESVLAESTDFSISLWTNVDVGRGSILFIPKDRRWWKVDTLEPQSGGNLLKCVPSEIQPSFR
jgi:hypothetical protein